MERVLSAFLIAFILSFLAYYFRLILRSSAIASFLISFAVLLGAGIQGLIVLALFFPITTHMSLAIRRTIERRHARVGYEVRLSEDELMGLPKDRPRLKPDWLQVSANGVVGSVFALLYFLQENALGAQPNGDGVSLFSFFASLNASFQKDSPLICGFLASIASAASDTASHEIGITSRGKTILLTNFKEVLPGTIGGVSLLGTFSATVTILIFVIAGFLLGMLQTPLAFLIVFILAYLGNVADSIFGALFEKKLKFWDNNLTNLVATFIAGFCAYLCANYLLR